MDVLRDVIKKHSRIYDQLFFTPRAERAFSTWRRIALSDSKLELPSAAMRITLETKLLEAQIEWPPEQHKYFIPIDVLNSLITLPEVEKELNNIFPKLEDKIIKSYAKSICDEGRRLFAILLCIGKSKFICDFLDEGITDASLPFVRVYTSPPSARYSNRPFELCAKEHADCDKPSHKGCGIKAMSSWTTKDINKMSRDQWLVLAPVFKKVQHRISHQELDDNVVLPFIEDRKNQHDSWSDGYSHLWGVRIHPAHQNVYKSSDPNVTEPLLAIKRSFSQDLEHFQKETNMLSTLAVQNHPHLIKLLATYKYKSHYHLIFPYANTNLRGYWDDTGIPHWNRETFSWFIDQICGIASGLNAIHNFEAKENIYLGTEKIALTSLMPLVGELGVAPEEAKFGKHGDIKPENILWSNELDVAGEEGILQISNFGYGRYLDHPTYAPPDGMLEKPISRASDIWNLGCVLLEFITWLLEGASEINSFASARGEIGPDGVDDDMFYTLTSSKEGGKTATVRKGVIDWIARLQTTERCSDMIRDVLKLVQGQLLVVDYRLRIRSESLVDELEKIRRKGSDNISYLIGSDAPIQDINAGTKLPRGKHTEYYPANAVEDGQDS